MTKLKAKQAAVGIDIGGTNTVLGIVDMEGNILSRLNIPTKTGEGSRN
jgi:predicted NBD/HSP70 family sugar kinase